MLIVQYAYNNSENEKMKILLFFANYSYNLIIEKLHSKESLVINIVENAKRLRGLHEQLKKNAEFINLTIGHYYNKRHEDVSLWKEGDKIYL